MVSGLAQTAADALPLPSHDDIYYHHQRLRLLDEEEEQALSVEERQQHQLQLQLQQQQQQAVKEQRKRRERPKLSSSLSSSSLSSSPTLVRRKSQAKNKGTPKTGVDAISNDDDEEDELEGSVGLSKQVSQLSIREGYTSARQGNGDEEEEEGLGWDLEDKELLESLEAEVLLEQETRISFAQSNSNSKNNSHIQNTDHDDKISNNNSNNNSKMDPRTGSDLDTPARNALESSTALASKKNE